MSRVVVLVSGTGRNLLALIRAQQAGHLSGDIVGVISSRHQVSALQHAAAVGIPSRVITVAEHPDRARFDAALLEQIALWRGDWVVLAGFMRMLTPAFTDAHAGRLINIHPSLLPAYPGLNTHARVLAAGDREHGATVHFVTPELDAGPAIIQGKISVRPQDGVEHLAERIMVEVEQRIYPQALAWCLQGRVRLEPRLGVCFDGRPLRAPLTLDAVAPHFLAGVPE